MKKEVAFKEKTVAKENLPFPTVLYPGHYGAFLAFAENENSTPNFCSCAYEAIENYIRIKKLQPRCTNSDPRKMYILSVQDFPASIIEELIEKGVKENNVMKSLSFEEKLCHECNLQTPHYRYCHEMYGGAFKQNYGWYIAKKGFEWGFDRYATKILVPEASPEELMTLLQDEEFGEIREKFSLLTKKNDCQSNGFKSFPHHEKNEFASILWERAKLSKSLSKYYRKIGNIIENEVRYKFGHNKIGEAWTSETILYYIIKKIYPKYTVHRHFRPKFMEGLELDIYIEELKIGIEYQGIQHYKPVKHWGGKESLIQLKERDARKKKLCEKLDIPLIYFEYNDGLSDEFVLQKLRAVL